MNKLRPKAIIFDLGSTLIEYESISWGELNNVCAIKARKYLVQQGISVPDEIEFLEKFEESKKDFRVLAIEENVEWDIVKVAVHFFELLGIKFDDDLPERFFDVYYEGVEEHLFVYDDTVETLKRLKQAYPVIGLISNTIFPERAHHIELKRFGIEPFLNFTIFSSTFGLRKPHPDIFQHAADKAGFSPEDCVYIGDRYKEDVQGPQSIGMSAILRLHEKREYPDDMPESVRKIRKLSELFDHLHI